MLPGKKKDVQPKKDPAKQNPAAETRIVERGEPEDVEASRGLGPNVQSVLSRQTTQNSHALALGASATDETPHPHSKFQSKWTKWATARWKKSRGRPPDNPDECNRWWELLFTLRSFQNVTTNTVKVFFTVSLCSEDPKRHLNRVKLLPKYTSVFTLAKGEVYTADNPIILYDRKNFVLPYCELHKHVAKVDMWQVSRFTFNEYFGVQKRKLALIANRDPNIALRLRKKMPKKDMQDKKKAKCVGDVALFSCGVFLEEIFDFQLCCENFTLELNRKHDDYKKLSRERKRLMFSMPSNRRGIPGQRRFGAPAFVNNDMGEWNADDGVFFWANCGKFQYTGTRTHLMNSFFTVTVYTGKPHRFILENKNVAMVDKTVPHHIIGRSLMNLRSVMDISVFQARVKNFTDNQERYIVGEICGNVKCYLRTRGMVDDDFRGVRPEQPKSTTTVSHLSPMERYLVVRVKRAEGLPATDADGFADPYLRVAWDNMVLFSPVYKTTVRPIFNQNFYFPVRMVFPELQGNPQNERKFVGTILKFELESKGDIKLELWDDDLTSADFLGGCHVTLQSILATKVTEKRTLLGPVKKPGTEEEANDFREKKKGKAWFENEQWVRFFDGSRTSLHNANIPNAEVAMVHFEAYFYPDFVDALQLSPSRGREDVEDSWKAENLRFTRLNELFAAKYAIAFPEAIGAFKCKDEGLTKGDQMRRFPCIGMHPLRTGHCPLMSFLSPIIIPEESSFPSKLMALVHCLCFELSGKQHRNGLIPEDGWKDPEYVLARRKGSPQDHAILLCSLLLGCKKDAYICKGTVWAKNDDDRQDMLVEHVWVMTKEEGWVTFWEPCNRQMYHLPNRHENVVVQGSGLQAFFEDICDYIPAFEEGFRLGAEAGQGRLEPPPAAVADKPSAGSADEDGDGAAEGADAAVPQGEDGPPQTGQVQDVKIDWSEADNLPTVGRMPKAKRKVTPNKVRNSKAEAAEEMYKKRVLLPTAPDQELLTEKNLVTWLPYDSIEVVFNDRNLWANRQNHHPACITYNFDEKPPKEEQSAKTKWEPKWEPFIQRDAGDEDAEELLVTPVSRNVSVQPELKPSIVDALEKELRFEMMQTMELYRQKNGQDTIFEHNEELLLQLDLFLEIQEVWLQIDPDGPFLAKLLDPSAELSKAQKYIKELFEIRRWNKHGSPYFLDDPSYKAYRDYQDLQWEKLQTLVKQFLRKEKTFPVKRGKKFRGFPVHFSTSEQENIRHCLMKESLPEYSELIGTEEEDIYFTVECKIFPLLGGVLSVWLYFGIQEPILKEAEDF